VEWDFGGLYETLSNFLGKNQRRKRFVVWGRITLITLLHPFRGGVTATSTSVANPGLARAREWKEEGPGALKKGNIPRPWRT